MPWRTAVLRGTRVLARCDEAGELRVDGGRVEIRYKPRDGKSYQAAARNLELDPAGEILPEEHCGEAERPAPKQGGQGGKAANGAGNHSFASEGSDAQLIAYTDGACSGNPGPAGVGVVLLEGKRRRELSEYLGTGTNNIAELTAILRVFELLGQSELPLVVHTDSQYAIGLLQKGWKPKANQELVRELKQHLPNFKRLKLQYVPGHAGVPLNERADALARKAVSSRESAGWCEVSSTHDRAQS